MEKKGLVNTTIAEISKKAGVSVGTFYNYFTSKDDIFIDIFRKADDYFRRAVAKSLRDSNEKKRDTIILYFRHYARYIQRRGLANVAQLYNGRNKFFAVKGRYMQELLKELIGNGQADSELSSHMTPDEIADCLFIAGRGVVFDWCVHEARYNLEEKMAAYMKMLIPVFLNRRRA